MRHTHTHSRFWSRVSGLKKHSVKRRGNCARFPKGSSGASSSTVQCPGSSVTCLWPSGGSSGIANVPALWMAKSNISGYVASQRSFLALLETLWATYLSLSSLRSRTWSKDMECKWFIWETIPESEEKERKKKEESQYICIAGVHFY